MWLRRLCALLFALASYLIGRQDGGYAHGTELNTHVLFDSCASLDEAATRKLLSLELRDIPAATAAQVRVRCETAEIFLTVTWGERLASRTLSVTDTPPRAWPRILALAAVELLTEPMIVTTAAPASKPTDLGLHPEVSARAFPSTDSPSAAELHFDLGFLARSMPRLDSNLLGVAAGLTALGGPRTARGRFGLRAGASVEHAEVGLDFGKGVVNAGSLVAQGVWAHQGTLSPWVGVGVRGGFAWLRGESDVPVVGKSFAAPWMGPEATVGVALTLAGKVALEAHVDGGYAALAAVGHGATAGSSRFGYDGAWIALNISLALQP